VTRVRLSRVFWIGAAAILIVAALVAVTSIVEGDFSDTDAKIVGTLFSLLLAGAAAISGLALVGRGLLVPFGWFAVAAAGFCFAVLAATIWDEFGNETLGKWAVCSLAFLVALLVVTTQRLLLRVEGLTWLLVATIVAAAVATLLTAGSIWSEDGGSDAGWQAVAIFWIFTILGYLLLPVLQRFTTAGPSSSEARVLGTLDGVELVATRDPLDGVAVEAPAPGERLVLRRRG
jgi:hypothetical protein